MLYHNSQLSKLHKLIKTVKVCAVTKGRSIEEVQALLKTFPSITCIAENRWPDCEEKFKHFKDLEKHFIGPLQSNKVRKVLPLVDCIQSIDSFKLLTKVSKVATELEKHLDFCFQVNISKDPGKSGFSPEDIPQIIEEYLSSELPNLRLVGLMTIGSRSNMQERLNYFQKFKELFDQINQDFFPHAPLTILSMGMSEDFELAIEAGASMIRPGRILFENLAAPKRA